MSEDEQADALNSDWGAPEEDSSAPDSEEQSNSTQKSESRELVDGEWRQIRDQYSDSEVSTIEARNQAVEKLRREHHLLSVPSRDELYRYDSDAGYYSNDAEQLIRMLLEKHLGKYNKKSEARNILYRLLYRDTIDVDTFGPPEFVCLENGVLNLRDPANPVLKDHDPEHMFARQWPVRYEPEAQCPRFEEFLEESVHRDDIKKLQEFTGYAVVHH